MSMPSIGGDEPLQNPADDRLGLADFAKRLAKSLLRREGDSGLVVGIHGPWGSGKTTLVNFILHFLTPSQTQGEDNTPKSAPTDEENQEPVIIRFNPWWFTGREDLALKLLDQFQATLEGEGERTREIRDALAGLSESLSGAPFQTLQKVGFLTKQVFKRPTDVARLKKKISEAIVKDGRRAIFVVDDVDRLDQDELRQLFGVIKALGDFPKTTYIVAFDRDVVATALSQMPGVSGADYLEKIVQVPFELPLPDRSLLRRLLFEKLDAILAASPEGQLDSSRWSELYWAGIDGFIRTPRDITQLSNALTLSYPLVAGEVNAADFIAVECLRVHAERVYRVIRRNADQFAGVFPNTYGGPSPVTAARDFHNGWLDAMTQDERIPAEPLVRALFPKVEAALGGVNPAIGLTGGWKRDRRVCSEEKFPVYFQLAIPSGAISSAEVRAVVALAADPSALSEHIMQLSTVPQASGGSLARPLLEDLVDEAEARLPDDAARGVVFALMDIGDRLLVSDPGRGGMFDFGVDTLIGRVLYRVLSRIDAAKRSPLLEKAMAQGGALATIVHEVAIFGQEHGKLGASGVPSSEQLVTSAELARLEELAVGRIRKSAESGDLRENPELQSILYRWRDWGSEEEVRTWVSELVSDDDGLLLLLERFLGESQIFSLTMHGGHRVTYHLDPNDLEPFIDPGPLLERARALENQAGLSERQELALKTFLRGGELRAKGLSPREDDFADD